MQKLLLLLFAVCTANAAAAAAPKPNIVFIMADDLGLGDVSFHARTILRKTPFIETPAIDALAERSLWFTDGHSATSLCAPTRYATMSGNNNYRSYAPGGVWSPFAPSAFEPGQATLGSVVRDAGYRTGFIGKWHLGGDFNQLRSEVPYRGTREGDLTEVVDLTRMVSGGPKACGFDYDFTSPCGIQGPVYLLYENQNWHPIARDSRIIHLNPATALFPQDLTDKGPGMGDSKWNASEMGKLLSAKAVEFVRIGAADNKPFFLYYCSPMVHLPHRPPNTFDGRKIKGGTPSAHLDMVLDLDMQVHRIVAALKATGTFENTLFVLTSDNGGLGDNVAGKLGYHPSGGWSGQKNSPLEGGHRVPFFAGWPGRIKSGITHELATSQDLVATFAALVNTPIPDGQALDSNNLLPLLTGHGVFHRRDHLVQQAGANHEVMLRSPPWKLVIQSDFKRTKFEPKALYNLEQDPAEKQNHVRKAAAKAHVDRMLQEYLEIVSTLRPTAPGRQIKGLFQ